MRGSSAARQRAVVEHAHHADHVAAFALEGDDEYVVIVDVELEMVPIGERLAREYVLVPTGLFDVALFLI